jgi:ABC-type sulfate/molybdate transport systems ATPase subunit
MICEYKDTILKATDISLVLGKNVILRDLNLEIRDLYRPGIVTGQVVGLLGPSGIGKTRLFRVLSGIDAPNTGSVTIGAE